MPTPELIHCVATVSGSVDRHIVKTTRHREPDGAATKHTHSGTTLCGAKTKDVLPFLSATVQVKSRFRCEDCAGVFVEQLATGPVLPRWARVLSDL